MYSEVSLTLTQSLQMVALLPCVLVVFYLVSMARNKEMVIVPSLYFLSLSMGILYYLLPAFISFDEYNFIKSFLVMVDLALPSLSFLLIFQFMLNRVPPLWYWSVLAIPLIAFGPIIFSHQNENQMCIGMDICIDANLIVHFVNVVISSFVFILLTLIVARKSGDIIGDDEYKKYKYWLIISIIIYSIILLFMDLLLVDGSLTKEKYMFGKIMVKIAFIYMVMTSIFRVFTDVFDIKYVKMPLRSKTLTKYESSLAERVEKLMSEDKVYREPGFNRASLAKTMGIGDHLLSRIVNIEYKKSFSDLTNDYRVKDARKMLSQTDIPVTTISFDVGFNSIASFNRVFKRLTGKSPSQYREDIRKDIV